jgi:hypothetical protein
MSKLPSMTRSTGKHVPFEEVRRGRNGELLGTEQELQAKIDLEELCLHQRISIIVLLLMCSSTKAASQSKRPRILLLIANHVDCPPD